MSPSWSAPDREAYLEALYTTKKTFYYNFFPTKEEEEQIRAIGLEYGELPINLRRVMIEMRDVYPPLEVNPNDRWRITKRVGEDEINKGVLILPWMDVCEHLLRHWHMLMANTLAAGTKVYFNIWDVTNETNPRKYDNYEAYMQMIEGDNFVLVCVELMKDRKLKVFDEIGLCWDCNNSILLFKLVL